MKKLHIITLLFLALMIGITGCKKYLDKKSDSSLTVPTSLENLQALLDFTDQINSNTPIYGEVSCDNYFLTDATYNSRTENDRDAYRWIPFEYFFPNDWSGGYQPIYTSNLCLERLDAIAKTSQNELKWNNVKGSALFLRAYHFLHLVWVHGNAYDAATSSSDPGIVLRLSPDFNEISVRASVKDTYERVIQDAKESIDYLPDNPQHVMRPSKAAAYGLLSRAYLSMRQYDSALHYTNLALAIKSSLLDYNNPSEVNVNASSPFEPFNKEIIFYSQPVSVWLSPATASFSMIDTMLYASYDNNDLRKTAFFRPSGIYQRTKNLYSARTQMFSGIATDELYLTRAECLARAGDTEEALNALNALLIKRWNASFVPVTAATAQDALSIILVERRKELVRRTLRWIDIKRLNKEGANIELKRIAGGQTYTLSPNHNRYALPLPKDIIDITGMPQNPQ